MMNEASTDGRDSSDITRTGKENGILDYLIILSNRKKMVFGVPIVVALLSAAISFLIPNAYRANTKILPPQQAQSGAAALMAQLGGVAGAAAGAAGIKNPNDLYLGMLKSRRIADPIVQRFDLIKNYKTNNLTKARKELESNTTIISGKDGLINIEVEDSDAQRAADIANGYAEELLKLTKVLAVTEASQRRLFFERELIAIKNKLAESEAKLKDSLGKYGVVSVDSESRATVETIAKLRATISAKETSLQTMKAFVTPNNNDFKRVQEELKSMRSQLNKVENGDQREKSEVNLTSKSGGLENIQMLRDVKYNQMLFEMLSKQYEIARLDESKDASIIQVLDKAFSPEIKSKPKRTIIVISGALIGFIFALMYVYLMDIKYRSQRDVIAIKRKRLLDGLLGRKNDLSK